VPSPSLVGSAIAAITLHGLSTWYGWKRLVRDTAMARPWRTIATATIATFFVVLPVVLLSRRLGARGLASVLAWPALSWFALWTFTVVGLLAIDLVRVLVHGGKKLARRPDTVDPSRRAVLARLGGAAAIGIAAGDVALGLRNTLGEHRIVDVSITIAKLPAALDGFTIVQLTDVHVGLTIGRQFISEVVARVNGLEPDLVAITGDLVDGPAAELRDEIAPLADLRSRHGTFMVTGNHEYYSGVEPWMPVLRELGIRMLRNERVSIEQDGASFDLAGIEDAMAYRWGPAHAADLDAALAGRDPTRALILLAHQPKQARGAALAGVDLQLSGHTHGGQIWPWHHLAAWQQGGLLAGHYQLGDTQLYVSRGVGYVGPPIRVGAPAEITRVILRAAG
jgi:predicted MPP superfamily phosphohydrolase